MSGAVHSMDGRMSLRRILLQAAAPGMEPDHSHGSDGFSIILYPPQYYYPASKCVQK